MRIIDGGVTAAKGFRASSAAAGIKYTARDDMALIVSDSPCTAAGVFTRNRVQAAPVRYDREIIRSDCKVRTVVVNAGIANACTGAQGDEACKETAAFAAKSLDINAQEVLVASTGVIGMRLPVAKVRDGILLLKEALSDTRDAANKAARAIMTTDTHEKEAAVSFIIDGVTCHLGGMAKGSGMIHPDMGTLLSFLTTDVAITKRALQKALSDAVIDTYNMISVDGDTSTNDTLLVLANGAAGAKEIDLGTTAYDIFYEALFTVCKEIAMMLAGDGEGATALFEVTVTGADTKEHARMLAKSVITSSLTKAAIFGHDANWGRILCALGYAGVDFDPENFTLTISSADCALLIYDKGEAQPFDEEEASRILSADKVTALCDLHAGKEEATAWGCDLSYDYVKINADYRS